MKRLKHRAVSKTAGTALFAVALGFCSAVFGASDTSIRNEQNGPTAVSGISGATRLGVIRVGIMAFTSEGDYSTHVEAEDHMFSSYNGYTLLNSYCHAWSCTPVYFIVNYPDVFQR